MSSQELFDLALRGRPETARRRRPWLAPGLLVPFAIIVVLGFSVWATHWFTPFDPEAIDTDAILEAPDAIHWFGTDDVVWHLNVRMRPFISCLAFNLRFYRQRISN